MQDFHEQPMVGQRIIVPSEAKIRLPVRDWQAFPVTALPELLRKFIIEGAKAIGCDPAMIALPALATCASAIGTARVLRLKRSWLAPCVLWCVVVARSGKLKSPAHNYAVTPLRRIDGVKLREHGAKLVEYRREKENHKAEVDEWRQRRKNGKRCGEQPVEPPEPRCIQHSVKDATVESLAPILQENPRGLLCEREEASGWLRSFNQYKGGRGSDVANWLEMYDAGPIKVNRKGAAVIFVPRAAVSICGTIQPSVLDDVLTSEFFGCGLAARILLAAPPSTLKQWTDADVAESTTEAYSKLIEILLGLEHDTGDGEPAPAEVTLSPEAKQLWIDWYNQFAHVQHEAADDDLEAALAKIEGVAVRLALVIHFVQWASSPGRAEGIVEADSMVAAIELARWFANEAARVYGLWHESEEDRELRRLADIATHHANKPENAGVVSIRAWQRARSHVNSEGAERDLQRLVAAGYGCWLPPQQDGPGRPGSARYKPNEDSDTDNNPASGGVMGNFVSVSNVDIPPGGVAHQQLAAPPSDENHHCDTETRQQVELQADLGLGIEPDPKAGQRWATEV